MEAGRVAYLQDRGSNATQEEAEVGVNHLGAALYEIAHSADNWAVLADTDGMRLANATTWVVRTDTDTPLTGEPDEDPFAVPEGGWHKVFGQSDIYT